MSSGYDKDPNGPYKITRWTWLKAASGLAVVLALTVYAMGGG